ncbi:MAG: hypothetical protein V4502_07490 [Pseudomonadota bacterium]
MIKEVELDHAFAEALADDIDFQAWLLSNGRFARHAGRATLLINDQARARKSAKHWWKHWWCRLSDGSESETDVFLVFEADDSRFALHIENKPAHGKLELQQARDYRRRAAFKSNSKDWLDYSDFEVLLLAPADFIRSHPDCVAQFDRVMTYEEVGRFVPLFQEALSPLPPLR